MPRPARLDLEHGADPLLTLSDHVSIGAIAAALGVHRNTVDVWRHRGGRAGLPFPEPDGYHVRRPWWRWSTIVDWATAVTAAEAS